MISEMRMLSAATKTMRPMVMKVTIALQAQGVEEGLVLLHPVGGHEALAGRGFELPADLAGLIDVVHLEFQHGDDVTQVEEALRVGEADKGPGVVVVVKARAEDSDDFEAGSTWERCRRA